MNKNTASFRFYEELNDFLPEKRKKRRFDVAFSGNPSVKDVIESLGIPHVEIDLILVNGKSVEFSYHLKDADDVAVYPVFESLDITELHLISGQPLRSIRFVLDVHLGKLARLLRLLGFDTLYRNDYSDDQIVELAVNDNRIILTRDVGILKYKKVTHGYWVRSTVPFQQTLEVIRRFDLCKQIRPFTVCIVCNGVLEKVDKNEIVELLDEKTAKYYDSFTQCTICGKIYWRGSHFEKLSRLAAKFCSELN